jgi:hypothetical protein
MVSLETLLMCTVVALTTGCLAGMLISAALTRERNAELEAAVWWLYHASEQAEHIPSVKAGREQVWEVLRGS